MKLSLFILLISSLAALGSSDLVHPSGDTFLLSPPTSGGHLDSPESMKTSHEKESIELIAEDRPEALTPEVLPWFSKVDGLD